MTKDQQVEFLRSMGWTMWIDGRWHREGNAPESHCLPVEVAIEYAQRDQREDDIRQLREAVTNNTGLHSKSVERLILHLIDSK